MKINNHIPPQKIKKYKVRKGIKIFCILALALLIIDALLLFGIHQYFPDAWKATPTSKIQNATLNKQQKAIQKKLSTIQLNSQYAILIDMEDYTTLYEKNASERIYPASLTKVLTAVTALDLQNNMKEKGEVTPQDLANLQEEGASVAGLQVGDVLTYEQALYALLLPSGADAANFLANHLGGSIDGFIGDMNVKAKGLGMLNSHFMNTSGLHEDTHYTTLQDMKKMMMHVWKNPVFRDVMTSLDYTIHGLASHPDGLKLKSTMYMYHDTLKFSGGQIIGGKTGFTPEAGRCLISVAKMKDGHLYMLISAKADDGPYHVFDALHVYETIVEAIK